MFNKRNLTTKALALLSLICMVFVLASCSRQPSEPKTSDNTPDTKDIESTENDVQNTQQNSQDTQSSSAENTVDENKILIAYFSRTGNTETVANIIAEETGGTLFKVETVTPYSDDYDECIDEAKKEQNEDARPALSTHVEDMSGYDVIYLGYPNWWGTMPMAMFTFLEEYDFSGKTIVPFCTHGGSKLGRSEGDIAKLVPDAKLLEGLAVSGSSVDGAGDTVKDWLKSLKFE